ncbi:MAG: hypothetical protein ACU85V_13950 [Gammaproteobacteria bacterium]
MYRPSTRPAMRAAASLCLFAAIAAAPVGAQQFDQAQVAELQQKAQAMQACLQQLDPALMQRLHEESQQALGRIQARCQTGDRDGAQSEAVAYGQEMASSPEFRQVQKCTEGLEGIQVNFSPLEPAAIERGGHVCDQ